MKFNNRKILAGIAEVMGIDRSLTDFTVAIDKLDKIGEEGVIKELKKSVISLKCIHDKSFLKLSVSVAPRKYNCVFEEWFEKVEIGKKGIRRS